MRVDWNLLMISLWNGGRKMNEQQLLDLICPCLIVTSPLWCMKLMELFAEMGVKICKGDDGE